MPKKPKKPKSLFRYRVTLGDWSGDGHSMTEDFYLVSTTDKDSILAAYTKTCKKLGYSLSDGIPGTTTLCVEYEDSVIREEDVAKLEAAGIKFSDSDKSDDSSDAYEILAHRELLIDLFVQFIQLADETIHIEHAEDNSEQLIGGYGLPSIGYGLFGG